MSLAECGVKIRLSLLLPYNFFTMIVRYDKYDTYLFALRQYKTYLEKLFRCSRAGADVP